MGQVLAKIYKIVEEHGGTPARIKFASVTGLPKKDAEEMKDKPEVIEQFKAAADEILGCDIDQFLKQ
jgi:hypothetical protein